MTGPRYPPILNGVHTPEKAAALAAARLGELTGADRHDIAVVLGSGWSAAADQLGRRCAEVEVGEVEGFAGTAVEGHPGLARSVLLGSGARALVFLGRTHLYEGHGVQAVAHPVRTAIAAGCRVVVLTNAAGSLREDMVPGQAVLISDHLNLTGASPLTGPRFVNLSDLYSARLRRIASSVEPELPEGVYAALAGPHFETPAEVRMLRGLGADLVGMSTALEAIAASAGGAEVLGISAVTNLAAGMAGAELDHQHVLAVTAASAGRLGLLLSRLLDEVAR